MMYYRMAIQVDPLPLWQWKSTALSSLNALFQWLRLYRALPQDRLRVFSSSSREDMNEQLARENMGYGSTSVTAAQFLQERMIGSREVAWGASEPRTGENQGTASIAVATKPSLNESSRGAHALDEGGMSSLDRRRLELERGTGGDHDSPYMFTGPSSMPRVLAWMKLLARRERGELEP
jgi:hypothetical protein